MLEKEVIKTGNPVKWLSAFPQRVRATSSDQHKLSSNKSRFSNVKYKRKVQ